jgi:uncharacterized protein YbjT (DUF2867 family)
MKILVTTPTGKIGRQVLRELLAPEFSVRVIARDPGRLPAEIHEQVEVIQGATDDPELLRRALDGVESMFWCVPSTPRGVNNVCAHYERFARAGSQAVRAAGTPRIVTLSATGKGFTRNAGPISGMHLMEDILDESGAAIRHLRCGLFMEHLLGQTRSIVRDGVLSYPAPGHVPIPMVAAADVADAALRWLVRQDWRETAGIAVHGPECFTLSRVAAAMESVLERPVQYREASANRYAQTRLESGASAGFARSHIEMFAELARGIARVEPGMIAARTPTTLFHWLENVFFPESGMLGASGGERREAACVCQF